MGKFIIKAKIVGRPETSKQIEVTEQAYFPGTVLFFRSEDQAKGETGVEDTGYTKDFGFDCYRPDLYGTHRDTKNQYPILKSVELNTQKAIYNLNLKDFTYQATSRDGRKKAEGLDHYYMPWIFVAPTFNHDVAIPKTITLCAKVLLLTQEKKYKDFKKNSSNPKKQHIKFAIVQTDENHEIEKTGKNETQIKTYSGTDINLNTLSFDHSINKKTSVVPISITVTQPLTKNYALIAYYTINNIDYILGQANFWRPKVNEGEHSALDTYHRDNPDLPRYNPYTSIPLQLIDLQIKDIKAPALNHESTKSGLQQELQILADQAGIHVNVLPEVKTLTIDPVDPFLYIKGSSQINTFQKINKPTPNSAFYQINNQNDTPKFHYALIEKLFFPEEADKIHFINTIFKKAFNKDKLIVQKSNGNTPAIQQTFWEVLKENNSKFLNQFFSIYFPQYVASLQLFCFVSTAVHARKEKIAKGLKTYDAALGIKGRGITLVSNDAKEKYDAYLHEVAHNFGLEHTFDEQNHIGAFKGTRKKQTQENYMDYYIERSSILKKQWKSMHNQKITWKINQTKQGSEIPFYGMIKGLSNIISFYNADEEFNSDIDITYSKIKTTFTNIISNWF